MSATLKAELLQLIRQAPQGISTPEICDNLDRSPQELGDLFETLRSEDAALGFAGLWLSPVAFQAFRTPFLEALLQYHAKNPSVVLVAPDEIAKGVGWSLPKKPLDRMVGRLAKEGELYKGEAGVRIQTFRPILPDRHREFLDRVKQALDEVPVSTPNPHQISQLLRVPSLAVEEILKLGVDAGEVSELGEGVFYTEAQLQQLEKQIMGLAQEQTLSASFVRDHFGTSRKYAVALLTHFLPRDEEFNS